MILFKPAFTRHQLTMIGRTLHGCVVHILLSSQGKIIYMYCNWHRSKRRHLFPGGLLWFSREMEDSSTAQPPLSESRAHHPLRDVLLLFSFRHIGRGLLLLLLFGVIRESVTHSAVGDRLSVRVAVVRSSPCRRRKDGPKEIGTGLGIKDSSSNPQPMLVEKNLF